MIKAPEFRSSRNTQDQADRVVLYATELADAPEARDALGLASLTLALASATEEVKRKINAAAMEIEKAQSDMAWPINPEERAKYNNLRSTENMLHALGTLLVYAPQHRDTE